MNSLSNPSKKIRSIITLGQDEDQRPSLQKDDQVIDCWNQYYSEENSCTTLDDVLQNVTESIERKDYTFVKLEGPDRTMEKQLEEMEEGADFDSWDEDGSVRAEWTKMKNEFLEQVYQQDVEYFVWSVEYDINITAVIYEM